MRIAGSGALVALLEIRTYFVGKSVGKSVYLPITTTDQLEREREREGPSEETLWRALHREKRAPKNGVF